MAKQNYTVSIHGHYKKPCVVGPVVGTDVSIGSHGYGSVVFENREDAASAAKIADEAYVAGYYAAKKEINECLSQKVPR